MNNVHEIEFCNQKITLSEETIDQLDAHTAFCSVGAAVLYRIDPDCELENEYLERIIESLKEDIINGIKHLSKRKQSYILDELDNMDSHDLLDLIDP